jgi:hypothetical protein
MGGRKKKVDCKKRGLNLKNCVWLTPEILTTWEAEIGKIKVQGRPGQNI